jgi:5-enolpyruvylshikimate-3-phosphate synthase
MHDISDTVMTLAAIAPLASGPTTIRNIANIRIKETDRLAALANELRKLGQGVTEGRTSSVSTRGRSRRRSCTATPITALR